MFNFDIGLNANPTHEHGLEVRLVFFGGGGAGSVLLSVKEIYH